MCFTERESYLIALAIDVDPGELQKQVFKDVLLNSIEEQERLARGEKK